MKKYIICLFVVVLVIVFASTAFALEFTEKGYPLSDFEKELVEALIKEHNTGDKIAKVMLNVPGTSRRGNKIVEVFLIETDGDITAIKTIWNDDDSVFSLRSVIEKGIEKKIKKEAIQRVEKALEGTIPHMHGDQVINEIKDPGREYLLGWKIGSSYEICVWEKGKEIIFDVWGKKGQIGRYNTSFTDALKIIPKKDPAWEPSWKSKQKNKK